jgi:hypothetical protein
MVRNLDQQAPGLAPLSRPGPPQPVDFLRADILEALPDDVKAEVVGPCMDMITQGKAHGQSDYVLMCLRGMLRRLVRGLYQVEVRRSAGRLPEIDVDITQW